MSRIIFAGGGTLGPVTPLLAVAEALLKGNEVFWIGTYRGPERRVVIKEGINFFAITSGKWRRYFDVRNIIDPFFILLGFFQVLILLRRLRPDVVVSAGGFVAVPVIWAAQMLHIPTIVHQQDVEVGLTNKLIARFATRVTAALPETKRVGGRIPEVIGNPVRRGVAQGDARRAHTKWNLQKDKPVLLVMGGGTGARAINELVTASRAELTKFCSVLHITGPDRAVFINDRSLAPIRGQYVSVPFLELHDLADAYAVADLVVSRAGVGAISELAACGKAVILIPIPKSHQVRNAYLMRDRPAVCILHQRYITPAGFTKNIRETLADEALLKGMRVAIRHALPPDATEKFCQLILELCPKS